MHSSPTPRDAQRPIIGECLGGWNTTATLQEVQFEWEKIPKVEGVIVEFAAGVLYVPCGEGQDAKGDGAGVVCERHNYLQQ